MHKEQLSEGAEEAYDKRHPQRDVITRKRIRQNNRPKEEQSVLI